MKWIGQHIYDLVARFRNDVYLEDLSTTTETNVLVVDSDGKVSKTTVITGDVTGVTAGSNITVTDPTGPVPTVALNTTLTGLTSITSTSFVGSLTGNADTVTTNANLTGHITSVGNAAVLGSFTSAELLAAVTDETGTGAAVFGTSPTLASPIISSISNTGTLTLPTSTDTLVGRDTTDTLKNKTLTEPTITGNGAIAGVFTGNLTGNVTGNLTGNADTVTTNADLTGDITSSGNATTIASGVIINDDISASAGIVDTKLATISTASKVSNSATTATSANTASAIVARDASGNFSAGTITAALTGNAATATKIASITNSDIVQLGATQTLSNKTFAVGARFEGGTSGQTFLQATAVAGSTTLTLPAATDTLVGTNTIDTLTFKTLYRPTIQNYARFEGGTSGQTFLQATAVAGSTTLILPAATDTLVGKATTDTLTNKTLTAPTITGAGAIAGVFTGNITGNLTGNADTVTTNANLTGPVTSTGNTTAIADGAITTAMQKHLQTFEFNGYLAGTNTNYYFPSGIGNNTGPFKHTISGGASGTTAITTQNLIRMGGKVMPYSGTVKLWKGWGTGDIDGSVTIGVFKYTPSATTPPSTSSVALVLVDDTTFTAIAGTASTNSVIGFSESSPVVGFSAGDILMTGIKGISGMDVYFTSTLEVEWD
jgi:hypothetical protein